MGARAALWLWESVNELYSVQIALRDSPQALQQGVQACWAEGLFSAHPATAPRCADSLPDCLLHAPLDLDVQVLKEFAGLHHQLTEVAGVKVRQGALSAG